MGQIVRWATPEDRVDEKVYAMADKAIRGVGCDAGGTGA